MIPLLLNSAKRSAADLTWQKIFLDVFFLLSTFTFDGNDDDVSDDDVNDDDNDDDGGGKSYLGTSSSSQLTYTLYFCFLQDSNEEERC